MIALLNLAQGRGAASSSSRIPARHVFERNVMSYRRLWLVFVAGFIEPVFYLLGLGVGLGQLVGDVAVAGTTVEYAAFVAPGLIAASAMNAAVFDSTFNFFYKLKYAKTFDAMLVTPLRLGDVVTGEVAWSMTRSGIYAAIFLAIASVLGLIDSWWSLLTIPAALLIGIAFSAVGTALTSFMRSWHDFDYIQLGLQPLFLASTTFFPLTVYPEWSRPIVQATPLYHGVTLCRNLAFGAQSLGDLWHVAYFVAMAALGVALTKGRLRSLLMD